MKIILASASPRRRELLTGMGIADFEIRPSQHEELPPEGTSPEDMVKFIALGKALDIAAGAEPDDIVIAADTLVFLGDAHLGKPKSAGDAAAMLAALSGNTHRVMTGLAVLRGDKTLVHSEVTEVRFREMSQKEIDWYISTGEPLDKAGAYGIQGFGGVFIEGINGDYYNVVGLPVQKLLLMLRELGLSGVSCL